MNSEAPRASGAQENPRPACPDPDALLRQLAEQKEATTRALRATIAIEKQLADAREELNRALMMASMPPEPPAKEAEPAEAKRESVLERAHEELEKERQLRNDERVVAAAQIARLEETVANARAKEQTAVSSLRRARIMWIMLTAVLLSAAAFVTRLAAKYPPIAVAAALRSGAPTDAAPPENRSPQGPHPQPEETRSAPTRTESMAPQAALEDAVEHMNRALAAYPDAKPEEVIRALRTGKMNIDPSSCLLAWNEGEPELLLQDRGGDRIRIAGALSACASAIEKAHQDLISRGRSH